MEVITRWEDLPYISDGVITIGFFDGFHIGHRKIISQVRQTACHRGGKSVVFTFQNHPLTVVRPEKAPPLISPVSFKKEFLETQDVDILFIPEFTRDFSIVRPMKFLEMLDQRFGKLKMIVGTDFHFGYKNEGNIAFARSFCENRNCSLEVAEPVSYENYRVSSSLIRRWIGEGKMEEISLLLNRDFFIENEVVPGNRRGQKIGFPTVNVPVPPRMAVPAYGVYSGKVRWRDQIYDALIYVGQQKLEETLSKPLVEAHLLGFNGNLYDEKVRVSFSRWLREPRVFHGLEDLKAQLQSDRENSGSV
jgi:riboflavin kinase/FMN adenylyltransferase